MIEHILQLNDIGGQDKYKKFITDDEIKIIKESHLILGIIDPLIVHDSFKYIHSIFPSIDEYNRIYVATKKDIMDEEQEILLDSFIPFCEKPYCEYGLIKISNKTGENIGYLKEKITEIVSESGNYVKKSDKRRFSKISIIGLGGIGKTSLVERIIKNTFLKNSKMTIGFNIETVTIKYEE